ncbi:MAG: sigma-70 family RNA polymerase sigma factor [Fimbriimonas sp.]
MSNTLDTIDNRDEARFNELVRNTYRKVFNMAFRLAGNRPDAEDLTQNAFTRAYRSFKDYEGDRPFENWIYRIVTRLFLDLLRSRKRRPQALSYDAPVNREGGDDSLYYELADHSPNPEQTMVQSHYSEELQKALDALSDEQRLLVTLADVEGVPYAEIANLMGAPVGTIRSRLHRTHKLLRTKLEAAKHATMVASMAAMVLSH